MIGRVDTDPLEELCSLFVLREDAMELLFLAFHL